MFVFAYAWCMSTSITIGYYWTSSAPWCGAGTRLPYSRKFLWEKLFAHFADGLWFAFNSCVQSHCKLISVGSPNVLFAEPALLCCLKQTSSHTQIEPWQSVCTCRSICDSAIGLFELELHCIWLDTISIGLQSKRESQPSDSLCCDFASDPLDSSTTESWQWSKPSIKMHPVTMISYVRTVLHF